MIKSFISDNKKKIGIIGIILAFIIGLILLINYFIPQKGILTSKLNNVISSDAVNVKDSDVGGTVTRYFGSDVSRYKGPTSYFGNPNLYCIKKDKDYGYDTAKFTVKACYYIRGLDVRGLKCDENGKKYTYSINGEKDYKYHVALLYAMSKQEVDKYKYKSEEDYGNPFNPAQNAIWSLADYYYEPDGNWGYHLDNDDDCKLKNMYGDERRIAEEAITFAEYMYRRKTGGYGINEGIKNTTNESNVKAWTKTIDNEEYVISGPYSIKYASYKRTYNTKYTKNLQTGFGYISVYNHNGTIVNSGIKVCDSNGTAQSEGANYISTHTNFYLRIPAKDLKNESKTFTIYYDGEKLKDANDSQYYYLKSVEYDKQELIEGEAKLDDFQDDITITIDKLNEKHIYTETPAEYEFDIEKYNDEFKEKLKGAEFEYKVTSGDKTIYTGTVNKNDDGDFLTTNIKIDKKIFNSLTDKKCNIIIEEKNAPNGYKKMEGNITIELTLEEDEFTTGPSYQNGVSVYYHNQKIIITKAIAKDNSDVNVTNGNNNSLGTGYTTENSQNLSKLYLKLMVPNKQIDYPDYKIKLEKYGENSSKLSGAYFQVEIGPEDAASDKEKDVFIITTNKSAMVGERLENSSTILGDVNNDGEVDGEDSIAIIFNEIQNEEAADIDRDGKITTYDKFLLAYYLNNKTGFTGGNNNQVTIEKNREDGSFEINLKDIQYTGTIKVEIEEILAPNGYKKIEDTLEIFIPIDADGKIGDVTVTGDKKDENITEGYKLTINKDESIASIKAQDKKIELYGIDKIKLEKQADKDENNNDGPVQLQGVEFSVYDVDADKTTYVTSNENGITNDIYIQYEYKGDNYTLGEIVAQKEYIIKETKTQKGYVGLSDSDEIMVTPYGMAVEENDKTTIKTAYIDIKNNTTQNIFYRKKENNEIITKSLAPNGTIILYYGNIIDLNKIPNKGITDYCNINDIDNDNLKNIICIIENKKITQNGTYSFEIKKYDSLNENKLLEGTKFAVYDEDNSNPAVADRKSICRSTTNSDGIASFEIPLTKSGRYSYYVQEIEASNGYIKPSVNEYIRLDLKVEYDSNENLFKVTEVVILNRLRSKNIKTNNEEIKYKNETYLDIFVDDENYDSLIKNDETIKKLDTIENIQLSIPNEPVASEGKFNIGIEKEDNKNNNKLSGAKFTLKDSNKNEINSENNPLITNDNGYAVTGDIQITEKDWSIGSRTFILKELEAPKGYVKLGENEYVSLEVYFEENISDSTKQYSVKEIIVTNNTSINIGLNDSKQIEQLKLDEEGKYLYVKDDETDEYIYATETKEYLEPGKSCICEPNGNPTIKIVVPNEQDKKIDLALKKFIVGVKENENSSETTINNRAPVVNSSSLETSTQAIYRFGTSDNAIEKTSLQPVEVSNGNIVHYKIRVYNEGQADAYASEIRDYLPAGVEYIDNEYNRSYGWKYDANTHSISTNYLAKNDTNEDKIIQAYNGNGTLKYQDLEVELKVIESDMYIGTLKNVAEISKMTDKDGNDIIKDIDSTTGNTIITRNGETIDDKYTPTTIDWAGKYYDDVANGEDDVDFEFIKLKDPVIAGRIWLDINEPTTKNPPENDIIDRHEIISGEETYRQIKDNGGLTVILYKNGEAWKEIPVNEDGTYSFTVPKSDDNKTYNKYEIRYTYNGMDYTNVLKNVGDDNKINSKAAEAIEERTAFNNKFGTINGKSDITYAYNETNTKAKYDITENMKINATTGIIDLSNFKDKNKDELEVLKYYNLGLKRRPTFDLALFKDIPSAIVTINGQTETYNYDRFANFDPSTQSFDEFIVKLRQGDFNDSLKIRDTDRDAINSIVAKYSLEIVNQSSTYGEATVIKDYYDNSIYDISRIYTSDNKNLELGKDYSVENGVITINVPSHVLGNNEKYYINVELSVNSNSINWLKENTNNTLRPENYAEICEYKTYTNKDKSNTPGIIDCDSAPDNYRPTDVNKHYEDDTGETPVNFLIIGESDNSKRKLSGNVFEDINPRLNVSGVKVQLVEITADGSLVVRDEVETADGNYTFEGFLPGNYFVRFSYGNDKKTVLTTENGGMNNASYNGQDYASTDNMADNSGDYWYTDIYNDQSDAKDNDTRRMEVNSYSQVLTNHIAEVLNSWTKNPINEEKVQELIEKTNMFADTARMKLSVEYATEETSEGVHAYEVSKIDFGLKHRSTNEIKLTKNVSKLTLKSSSGETLVEATPQRDGNNVQWMVDSFVKVEQEDVLINGANLEIEYTMTLENIGEEKTKVLAIVDYVDNNLRFDETSNAGWQVVKASDLTENDAIEELKALNIEAANDLTSTTELVDGTLVDSGINLEKRQTIIVTKVDNTELKPGDTINVEKLTLTKTLTTSTSADDDLSYENKAEILSTYNVNGRRLESSIPGNLDPDDPDNPLDELDEDNSEPVRITNPTGQTRIYYVLGLAVAVILAAGVIAIKKFVLGKKA